jgi:hypothetical protein
VYEDDVAHATHYVRYRVVAVRNNASILIGLALLAVVAVLIFTRPSLAPLSLPLIGYLGMLWRARNNMVRAISQLAIECGKPFGMTAAQDDF